MEEADGTLRPETLAAEYRYDARKQASFLAMFSAVGGICGAGGIVDLAIASGPSEAVWGIAGLAGAGISGYLARACYKDVKARYEDVAEYEVEAAIQHITHNDHI